MILDRKFHGILDQGAGCLVVFDDEEEGKIYPNALNTIKSMEKVTALRTWTTWLRLRSNVLMIAGGHKAFREGCKVLLRHPATSSDREEKGRREEMRMNMVILYLL